MDIELYHEKAGYGSTESPAEGRGRAASPSSDPELAVFLAATLVKDGHYCRPVRYDITDAAAVRIHAWRMGLPWGLAVGIAQWMLIAMTFFEEPFRPTAQNAR
mmetsp:Transcript_25043/g.78489  ORF Transcript_25043/g.78489 Transcript_25043/m.78489 type:complete len:103 (+) Transcript_25043:249-557(+)